MNKYIFDIEGFLLNASLLADKEPDYYKDLVYQQGPLPITGDPEKLYIKDNIIYTFNVDNNTWDTIKMPLVGQNGITTVDNVISISADVVFDCGTAVINV